MFVPTQPIDAQVFHQVAEIFEPHRFDEIAVDIIPVGMGHVFFGFRGGEDDDWDAAEFLFFFDDAQDFKPIYTGEAQV